MLPDHDELSRMLMLMNMVLVLLYLHLLHLVLRSGLHTMVLLP
jgi:hypothetical protein